MNEIVKEVWAEGDRGPRPEFLRPASILWLRELAEETHTGLAVCQTLVQHSRVCELASPALRLCEVRTVIIAHGTDGATEVQSL